MRNEERRRSHPNVAPKRSENRETAKRGNQASLPAPRKVKSVGLSRVLMIYFLNVDLLYYFFKINLFASFLFGFFKGKC